MSGRNSGGVIRVDTERIGEMEREKKGEDWGKGLGGVYTLS